MMFFPINQKEKSTIEAFKENLQKMEEHLNFSLIGEKEVFKTFFNDYFPNNFIEMKEIKENFIEKTEKLELPIICLPANKIAQLIDPLYFDKEININIIGLHSIKDSFILRDINYVRAHDKMIILNPCDEISTLSAIKFSFEHKGPVYLRLSDNVVPPLYNSDVVFECGRAIILKQGKLIALIGTGNSTHQCLEASEELYEYNPWVIDNHTIKPVDRALVKSLMHSCSVIVTVEEHVNVGGLGTSIAEVLAEEGFKGKLIRIGQEISSTKNVPNPVEKIVKLVKNKLTNLNL